MLDFIARHRWASVRATPLPDAWAAILDDNVPYLKRLSPEARRELDGHVQVFLAAKRFEGCRGLEITDEIRVTIAAQACVLVLGRCAGEPYPDLGSVVVYPHAYVAKRKSARNGGVVVEEDQVRLGESWGTGTVVLAWDAVRRGAEDVRDGHNVVFHEFAHQLDQEDGAADGTPDLGSFQRYAPWARVLGAEFQRLVAEDARGVRTVIDRYGATDPAEFFAVITEAFFEKPHKLRARHPELYAELLAFYVQDPAGFVRS